jgi:hypothetical protein
LDPNPQIPEKRSVTVVMIYAQRINAQKSTKNSAKKKYVPKVAQICGILSNFGCFLPGNKDSNPCLKDPDFPSPAKKGQRVGSLNPNPWIRNNTTFMSPPRMSRGSSWIEREREGKREGAWECGKARKTQWQVIVHISYLKEPAIDMYIYLTLAHLPATLVISSDSGDGEDKKEGQDEERPEAVRSPFRLAEVGEDGDAHVRHRGR